MEPADVGCPCVDVQGDDRWMSQHNHFVNEAREKEPEVVFLGDSLIRNLANTELWTKMFEPLHCLNFGIGGDQTQHILWRIENGELDNIEPKVVVLVAGTNNHGHTAEEVTQGLMKLVEVILNKQPASQVIVLGIPPRGEKPNKLRDKFAKINAELADQLSNIPSATFLPVDPATFVNQSDNSISHLDMHDYLHFTPRGYMKLMEPLLDLLQELLRNFVKVDSTDDTGSMAGDLATKDV